jgi:uncharacterized small protein (DUF1192 family)
MSESNPTTLQEVFSRIKQTYYINKGNTDANVESIINLLTNAIAEKDQIIEMLQKELERLKKESENKT